MQMVVYELRSRREQLRDGWEAPYDTYMFSPKRKLACLDCGDGKYYVCNGDYWVERDIDYCEVYVPHTGETLNWLIRDWEERSLHDLTDEERRHWYLPTPMSMYDRFMLEEQLAIEEEELDDEIAF